MVGRTHFTLGRALLPTGGTTLLALALVLLASAPSAVAHDTCTYHGSDPDALGSGAENTVACLKDNHTRLDVCDRHADGNYAFARVKDYEGGYWVYYDNDGYGGTCGHYTMPWFGIAYNVCVQNEGCGGTPYYLSWQWGQPVW